MHGARGCSSAAGGVQQSTSPAPMWAGHAVRRIGSRESRRQGHRYNGSGRLGAWEPVVGHAGPHEPVSASPFPRNRENTGNLHTFRHRRASRTPKGPVAPVTYAQIPCASEQGICPGQAGKLQRQAGTRAAARVLQTRSTKETSSSLHRCREVVEPFGSMPALEQELRSYPQA